MKVGSKYYPLFEYLQPSGLENVSLSFAEIETLMNQTLLASARKRKNWWSNRDSPSALQASAWISAGYHVERVDLQGQIVTFRKFQAQYNIEHVGCCQTMPAPNTGEIMRILTKRFRSYA